jgi:hypothetical protein
VSIGISSLPLHLSLTRVSIGLSSLSLPISLSLMLHIHHVGPQTTNQPTVSACAGFSHWLIIVVCLPVQKVLKHRRVKHFGYEFRYDNNNVDKDKPLPGGMCVLSVSMTIIILYGVCVWNIFSGSLAIN